MVSDFGANVVIQDGDDVLELNCFDEGNKRLYLWERFLVRYAETERRYRRSVGIILMER